MTTQELLELAENIRSIRAEKQTVEVKAASEGCPKRLYDTLSSFSNQESGGVILFGMDERKKFKVTGVYDIQDLQQQVTEQCNQMEPPVRAVFTSAEYQEKWICAAEIPPVPYEKRPCYYKGKGLVKGAFLRVGEADLPMTDYEVYSYEAYRSHRHDDIRPVKKAILEELDQDRLSQYLLNRRVARPGFAKLSEERALEMMHITVDGAPTLAAVLNFALYPQGYFPQLAITCVVVPGTELGETSDDGERFIDNKRIEGTLSEMVEEAVAFCRRNMKVATVIDPQTGLRKDRTEYPLTAVREAVLNAVIHRDYSTYTEGTAIQIYMYRDRVEIHSPGGLYGRMTVEELGTAHQDIRNPALAVMAEVLTGAENRYSGIPTMRREMAEQGLRAPRFESRPDEFVVTFYNASSGDVPENTWRRIPIMGKEVPKLGPEEEKIKQSILDFCRTPRTRREIADFMGKKTAYYVTKNVVTPMVEEGVLKLTLPDTPKSKNQKFYAAVN